jgi:predicted metal-binding membrane protein
MSAVSEAALTAVLRRDRMVVVGSLAAITALAWGYTLWLAASMNMGMEMSSGMSMPGPSGMRMLAPALKPWTVADFVFTFVMWAVMMVGMMTPSAAPMILLYARVGRQAETLRKPHASAGFFASGYLLAWVGFSLVVALAQYLLERAALLTPMMAVANAAVGAVLLIAAGLYQWSPAKHACLRHCQSPLSFILQHGFRTDPWGSLSLGFRHGLYCVGCCWALMALLFVAGIMNVLWIAGLTIFVLLEKVVPLGRTLSRIGGVALVVWGGWLLASAL